MGQLQDPLQSSPGRSILSACTVLPSQLQVPSCPSWSGPLHYMYIPGQWEDICSISMLDTKGHKLKSVHSLSFLGTGSSLHQNYVMIGMIYIVSNTINDVLLGLDHCIVVISQALCIEEDVCALVDWQQLTFNWCFHCGLCRANSIILIMCWLHYSTFKLKFFWHHYYRCACGWAGGEPGLRAMQWSTRHLWIKDRTAGRASWHLHQGIIWI